MCHPRVKTISFVVLGHNLEDQDDRTFCPAVTAGRRRFVASWSFVRTRATRRQFVDRGRQQCGAPSAQRAATPRCASSSPHSSSWRALRTPSRPSIRAAVVGTWPGRRACWTENPVAAWTASPSTSTSRPETAGRQRLTIEAVKARQGLIAADLGRRRRDKLHDERDSHCQQRQRLLPLTEAPDTTLSKPQTTTNYREILVTRNIITTAICHKYRHVKYATWTLSEPMLTD